MNKKCLPAAAGDEPMGGESCRPFGKAKTRIRRPKSAELALAETGMDADARVVSSHAVTAQKPKKARRHQRRPPTARVTTDKCTGAVRKRGEERLQRGRLKMVQKQIGQHQIVTARDCSLNPILHSRGDDLNTPAETFQ